MKRRASEQGTLRIIGGEARGRKIACPAGQDTRPTTDRVREAVFGILHMRLRGARVLDLFAGSGAMGLEAISRGAEQAVLVDASREVCGLIEGNIAKLGCEGRAQVRCGDAASALRALGAAGERFDVIFLDPPYGKGLEQQALALIRELGLLALGGVAVVEHPAGDFTAEGYAGKTRRYGKTGVTILTQEDCD